MMNKQEFEKGQEVWAKLTVVAPSVDVNGEIQLSEGEGGLVWVKPEEIMTAMPEKPVIPQAAADWLEEAKNKNMLLSEALDLSGTPTSFDDWLSEDERKNQEIFARAWLDGYVVQENLYYVSIPNVYHGDFGYSEIHENYSFYNKNDVTNVRFELTESEIKENHAWAWEWAKPVEDN